jgi:restriction system protein
VRSPNGELNPILTAHSEYTSALKADMLRRLQASPPAYFEQVVVKVLIAAGYGLSGEVLGKSHDGGIDGVLYEDPLHLRSIYLQAKRWTATVGRPDVQKFIGALEQIGAREGVFVSTSHFSRHAHECVKHSRTKVALVDQTQFIELMYKHNIGVSSVLTLEIKQLEPDFFDSPKRFRHRSRSTPYLRHD